MMHAWDLNTSSIVKSVESKVDEERLTNAFESKEISGLVSSAENVSAAQIASLNTRITNLFRELFNEQHSVQLREQADKELVEGDIDAGLHLVMQNASNSMRDQRQELLSLLNKEVSQTNEHIERTDLHLQNVKAEFTDEIKSSTRVENNLNFQELKNVTMEHKVLESAKFSLLNRIRDLEQETGHFTTTQHEDSTTVQNEIGSIKLELDKLRKEMGDEAQLSGKLEGEHDFLNRLSGKESDFYTLTQQTSKRIEAELIQLRSMLNITAQDIYTRISNEEKKRSDMTADLNGSIALLRQKWYLLRSVADSVSKMVGPPGPPGPRGPIGMQV